MSGLDELLKTAAITEGLRRDFATLRRLYSAEQSLALLWKGLVDAGISEEKAIGLAKALSDEYEGSH